jgi:hypothetical protein
VLPGGGKRGLELGTAIQGVRPFASFHLDELAGDLEAFRLSKQSEHLPLRFDAEA